MNDYGPQPAPDDPRIANRPNNPNWHGVKAWFDEAAAPLHLRIEAPDPFTQCVAERAAIIQRNLPKLAAETAWQIAVWHVEAEDLPPAHTPGEDVDSWLRSFDGYNGGER